MGLQPYSWQVTFANDILKKKFDLCKAFFPDAETHYVVAEVLVDMHFPDAEAIRVVLDNLNTHTLAALQEAFGAEEVQRVLRAAGVALHPQTWQLIEYGGD